jgi:choice-of-anchor C domain-containing protein
MKILGLLAGAALLLSAQSASAVTITNGSFESPIAPNPYVTLAPGDTSLGWTVGGAGVDHIANNWQASDGNQSLDLSALNAGSVSQQLNNLTVGQEYTVTFDMAGNPTGDTKSMSVSAGGTFGLYSFNTAGHTVADMGWTTFTYVFIATAVTDILEFASLNFNSGGPALDNVSIAATPIPGAILLFGSALGGMGFLGYRRKKLAAAEA